MRLDYSQFQKEICPSPSDVRDVRQIWQIYVKKLSEVGLCPKIV